MRTTINIDDRLFKEAVRLTGMKEKTALVRKSLKALIEHKSLMGRGIGYIDAHLLASVTLAAEVQLWTRDNRLAGIASIQGLNWIGHDEN